jgi:hypothetical protein
MGPESQAGYLLPGEFDFTIGYRHQYSFRHFVGDVEQKQRIELGTQVMNKINLMDYNLTYAVTPRWSLNADLPLLLASRRSNNAAFTTTSQGIGDVTLTAQTWLRSPTRAVKGNVQLGFGMLAPTGKADVQNSVDRLDGKGAQNTIVDYSIQPGSGGWGIVFRWAAFRSVGRSSAIYFNGNYTATPQNTNNVLRTGQNPTSLTAYNSISDQYLVQAGFATPISRVRGLSVTIGPRWEGVPAKDLIGDNLGFRRPGYAVSIEPGFQYARGKNMLAFSFGKAIHRDRTRSIPDRINGGHGDAAFADYVWFGSYSLRFGKPSGGEHN